VIKCLSGDSSAAETANRMLIKKPLRGRPLLPHCDRLCFNATRFVAIPHQSFILSRFDGIFER
jgi:hypothetical protein